jgi:hypothetical protein
VKTVPILCDLTKSLMPAKLSSKSGHVPPATFTNSADTGKPLSPRNILRDSLHPTLAKLKQPKMGFHCLRRFRESVLQKSEASALLVDYWMGHENREMGTRYAKQLVEDVAWRKQWAQKIGLGFKLTDLQLEIGQLGQLSARKTLPAKAA